MEPRPTDAGKPWLAESAGKWLSEAANEANTRITKLVDGAGAPAPTRPVPPVAAAAAVAATYSDTVEKRRTCVDTEPAAGLIVVPHSRHVCKLTCRAFAAPCSS